MKPRVSDRVLARNTAEIGSRATRTALAPRFVFVQADMREGRIGEHAIGDQPAACRALAARQIGVNDPKIVEGCVSELRTAGAFADGPNIGRAGRQPIVNRDVAARVERDAGSTKPDLRRVRRPADRDKDIAAIDDPIGRCRLQMDANGL
jgi:hypothetical protein